MDPTTEAQQTSRPLKDELEASLPQAFSCKIRYLRTPPKSCDPLFSPPPGQDPENTRLSSHFVTVSVTPSVTPDGEASQPTTLDPQVEDVFILAIEVMVYTTEYLTTIFVSKADTTGYLPNPKLSRTKIIVTTFLRWLVTRQRKAEPKREVVVSLFARAQNQYLFPGSIENSMKKPLDDQQLIKWWAKVLDPIFDLKRDDKDETGHGPVNFRGYITVPGFDASELRSYFPSNNFQSGQTPRWRAGDPLAELAQARGVYKAPPRSLLPRFPDDPKARFMQDLDDEVGLTEGYQTNASPSRRKGGKWNGVTDLKRFWEAMEFRQECSSGRVVGFIWLTVPPLAQNTATNEQNGQKNQEPRPGAINGDQAPDRGIAPTHSASPTKKRRRKPLTGPVIPRKTRPKIDAPSFKAIGSNLESMLNSPAEDGLILTKEGYDKAVQTLLHLDFATQEVAARSTSKWIAEVCGICAINGDWAVEISGTAVQELSNSSAASTAPIQVNDLSNLISKKRKVGVSATSEHQSAVQENGQVTNAEIPTVNVLSSSIIRKKVKSAATTT